MQQVHSIAFPIHPKGANVTVGTVAMLCGVRTGILFPVRASDFVFLQSFQWGPETKEVSCVIGTGGSFPRVKWPVHETEY